MITPKFTIQLFILLALCGILVVCFINVDNFNLIPAKYNKPSNPTESIEPFQTIDVNNISRKATIINYKKKLNALFAANVTQENANLKQAYLNELHIQTLPKTNTDDIIVKYFYFKNGAVTSSSPALDQLIDFILTEKANRMTDFFLRAENGISIDILFKYNFKNDFNDIVDVEAIVTELMPQNRIISESEKNRYKSLLFDKCEIDYIEINTDEFIKLTLKKSTIVTDYVPPVGVSGLDKIEGAKEVMQEFIIYLRINNLTNKLSSSTNTLELTITDFIPLDSYLEYKVGMRIGNITTYTNYLTWQMYIKNASVDKVSANDFLKERLSIKQKELLHDKYNDIITPMFMVDNKISNLENSINTIKDAYNFNKLNNMSNNIRFYPVTQ